jgi:FkbM family methyltransferase
VTILKRLIRNTSNSKSEPPRVSNKNGLTREHVLWGYRLFLDRDPESEAVIMEKLLANSDTRTLRRVFMLSPEFIENNRDLTLFYDSRIVIAKIADNLRLFVDLSDSVIGWEVIRGNYEKNEIDFVRDTIKSGQNTVDIGANIGLFTITMASLVGPTGSVYAFEPLEGVAALLAQSIRENNFDNRVVLVSAALSDKVCNGQLIHAIKSNNGGGAYLKMLERIPAGHQAIEVPVLTLDSYGVKRPVAFIKIDIEGNELLAFRGARNLLIEDRPIILSELHPAQLMEVSHATPAEFVAEMESLNYKCYDLHGKELHSYIDEGAKIKSVVFMPK